MIELYYWPTPNSHKIVLFLEECGLGYKIRPVDIAAGGQFDEEFLKISPNNKMPTIVDLDCDGKNGRISIFESAAILIYLGEKTGRFLASRGHARFEVLQWTIWQAAGLGPMAGQSNHFNRFAPEGLTYAVERYRNEMARLYRVLDNRLADREFLAGDYSIADMASYPWAALHELLQQNIADFPHVSRWLDVIAARPATIRAYALEGKFKPVEMTEEARKILLNQNADTLKRR